MNGRLYHVVQCFSRMIGEASLSQNQTPVCRRYLQPKFQAVAKLTRLRTSCPDCFKELSLYLCSKVSETHAVLPHTSTAFVQYTRRTCNQCQAAANKMNQIQRFFPRLCLQLSGTDSGIICSLGMFSAIELQPCPQAALGSTRSKAAAQKKNVSPFLF